MYCSCRLLKWIIQLPRDLRVSGASFLQMAGICPLKRARATSSSSPLIPTSPARAWQRERRWTCHQQCFDTPQQCDDCIYTFESLLACSKPNPSENPYCVFVGIIAQYQEMVRHILHIHITFITKTWLIVKLQRYSKLVKSIWMIALEMTECVINVIDYLIQTAI